jgi:tRNA pseudouridine13 synthase
MKVYGEIMELGGFPNFFGLQRFGSIRTNTHKIGRLLVHGEYEKAAMTYLYDPQFDTEDFRINFAEHNDPMIALREFPERLSFERSLLGYLNEHGNLEDAFSVLPRNLSIMFVHAYQSYIFNRILSERIRKLGEFNEPQVGDVVLKIDDFFNSDKSYEISVNRMNQKKISDLVNGDSLRVSIPLFGYDSDRSKGVQGEIEESILEEEDVDPSMFRIQGHADLSSSGERRIVSCKPLGFEVHRPSTLQFSLGKGIYATSLVREFLKQ